MKASQNHFRFSYLEIRAQTNMVRLGGEDPPCLAIFQDNLDTAGFASGTKEADDVQVAQTPANACAYPSTRGPGISILRYPSYGRGCSNFPLLGDSIDTTFPSRTPAQHSPQQPRERSPKPQPAPKMSSKDFRAMDFSATDSSVEDCSIADFSATDFSVVDFSVVDFSVADFSAVDFTMDFHNWDFTIPEQPAECTMNATVGTAPEHLGVQRNRPTPQFDDPTLLESPAPPHKKPRLTSSSDQQIPPCPARLILRSNYTTPPPDDQFLLEPPAAPRKKRRQGTLRKKSRQASSSSSSSSSSSRSRNREVTPCPISFSVSTSRQMQLLLAEMPETSNGGAWLNRRMKEDMPEKLRPPF
ncbi:hypothetical protein CERZMDRAFT_101562 [Cercospora zeae-maydis SCOH1-5]|uniref:Uncharacterized protein n=1 Tax=Cercospora zeae-maydis SCOH1-5 TaxID=717836 RepID=A0A6A6F3H8_9PEZI|nr:hypothetical protein CERZMDRAFT_101562 [Cercospora zeae-maydis SCOH1-5]